MGTGWWRGRAREAGRATIDAVQRAHFAQGIDIGSRTAPAAVAGSIGLDEAAADDYLDSDAGIDTIQADLDEARELEITSVPTFVIDHRYLVQGAQEASVLRSALEEIARREAVDASR